MKHKTITVSRAYEVTLSTKDGSKSTILMTISPGSSLKGVLDRLKVYGVDVVKNSIHPLC
jgi:hypothetical protein